MLQHIFFQFFSSLGCHHNGSVSLLAVLQNIPFFCLLLFLFLGFPEICGIFILLWPGSFSFLYPLFAVFLPYYGTRRFFRQRKLPSISAGFRSAMGFLC